MVERTFSIKEARETIIRKAISQCGGIESGMCVPIALDGITGLSLEPEYYSSHRRNPWIGKDLNTVLMTGTGAIRVDRESLVDGSKIRRVVTELVQETASMQFILFCAQPSRKGEVGNHCFSMIGGNPGGIICFDAMSPLAVKQITINEAKRRLRYCVRRGFVTLVPATGEERTKPFEFLSRKDQIISRFKAHYYKCEQLPSLTRAEMLELNGQAGEVIEAMIQGRVDKQAFMDKLRELADISQEDKRMFLVETPQDVYNVFFAITKDEKYAEKERSGLCELATLYRSFKPKLPYKAPDVLFGIMPFTGNMIVPYPIYSRQLPGMSLLESHQKDPLRLMKEGDLETIREFWLFLRREVTNDSAGNKALLKN